MKPQVELDHYDTRILAELQADARLSLTELGRRVHLSQPAVAERVRKLEAGGVITGYRATVDLGALGYVAHLDAVVTKFCILTETSTSIILNAAREHLPMLPPRREDVKPPIKKVENA